VQLTHEVESLRKENACFRSHLCHLIGAEALERLALSPSPATTYSAASSAGSSPVVTSPEYTSAEEDGGSTTSGLSRSSGGWGGSRPATGVTLFAALFLFSFIFNPSSLLLDRSGRRTAQTQRIAAPSTTHAAAGPLAPYASPKILVNLPPVRLFPSYLLLFSA